MRLNILNNGHRWVEKFVMKLIRGQIGYVPGPIQLAMYRSNFFGRQFTACTETALRKTRYWNKTETELFAAFISRQNQCHF